MGITHNSIDIVAGGNHAHAHDLRHQSAAALSKRRAGRLHSEVSISAARASPRQTARLHVCGRRAVSQLQHHHRHQRQPGQSLRPHTIKAGIYLQRSRKDQTSFGDNNGNYNFGDTPSNPFDTGYGYSNAATGVYQKMDQASAYINGQYRYWNVEGFIQDTWKITPRLTLDYGLRAVLVSAAVRRLPASVHFRPLDWDPAKAPRLYQPTLIGGQRMAYDAANPSDIRPVSAIGLEVPNTGDPFNGVCQGAKCANKYLQQNRGPNGGRASASPGISPASKALCCAPALASITIASKAIAFSIWCEILPKVSIRKFCTDSRRILIQTTYYWPRSISTQPIRKASSLRPTAIKWICRPVCLGT